MEYTEEQILAMKQVIFVYNFMAEKNVNKSVNTIFADAIRVLAEPMKEQLSKNNIDIPSA